MKKIKQLKIIYQWLLGFLIIFLLGLGFGLIRFFLKSAPEKIWVTGSWSIFPYENPLLYSSLLGIEALLYLGAVFAAIGLLYLIFKKGLLLYLGIFFLIFGGLGIIVAGYFVEPLAKTLGYFIGFGIFGLLVFLMGVYGLVVMLKEKIKKKNLKD